MLVDDGLSGRRLRCWRPSLEMTADGREDDDPELKA